MAAAPYSRLREPENRLADLSTAESSYPVVDRMNSCKPLFSSQGEYRFTFSYRHIMNSNRVPKQIKTITWFEPWRQKLQYSLSLDANFAQFLADNFTWLKKFFYCSQQRTRAWWRRRSYHSPTYCLSKKLTPWGHVGPDSQLLPRYFT